MTDPGMPDSRAEIPQRRRRAILPEDQEGTAAEPHVQAHGTSATPPPNPFGQPSARHASPSQEAPQQADAAREDGAHEVQAHHLPVAQPSGFAPPSSPGFGPGAGYQPDHGQPPVTPTGYAQSYGMPPLTAPVAAAAPASGFATTGLVLGIIGVVGGIFFGWTILLSVAALVLGFIARTREPHAAGRALAAIVTGFLGVFLSVGWLVYSIVTWLALSS